MYVIDRLKKEFPQHIESILRYDTFIRRYHDVDMIERIFNDEKENFHFLEEAYKIGPGHDGYNKAMAYYERTFNTDPDFLEMLRRHNIEP